jgi:hypothetical protein
MSMKKEQFVIPAQQGTKTLVEDDGKIFVSDIVIGWLIIPYSCGHGDFQIIKGSIGAITSQGIEGLGDSSDYYGILHPDGSVENCCGRFDSIEEAQIELDSMKSEKSTGEKN